MTTLFTLKELDIFGVLVTPMLLYIVLGVIVFIVVRTIIARLRLDRFIWHPSLFDLALCTAFISLVTIIATYKVG